VVDFEEFLAIVFSIPVGIERLEKPKLLVITLQRSESDWARQNARKQGVTYRRCPRQNPLNAWSTRVGGLENLLYGELK
jgi:hypothetical protein